MTIRAISLAYIVFLSILALDIFSIPFYSGPEKLLAFAIHLIPAFLALFCLIVAWRREVWGGILFLILAVGFTLFFRTYSEASAFLTVSLTPIIIGGLFIWEGATKARKGP